MDQPENFPSDILQLNPSELEVISNPSLALDPKTVNITNVIYGRMLSGKAVNKKGLKNLFDSLWQNKSSVEIEDYADGIVTLTFESAAVKNRVLKGQPWHFAGNYIILIETDAAVQVGVELFQKIPFWVQVYGIPLAHLAEPNGEKLEKEIANSMGEFIEFDPNCRRSFMRLRVYLDSARPLLRGKLLKLDAHKDNIWVSFRYERLSKFCHFCGRLDHIQKDCAALMEEYEGGNSPSLQYNNSLKIGGLVNRIATAVPSPGTFKRSNERSMGEIALEASRIRPDGVIRDQNAKRLKIGSASELLSGQSSLIPKSKADEDGGSSLIVNKLKDVDEGTKNNLSGMPKSLSKGVKIISSTLKSANKSQNEPTCK